jgi:alkanesulfonate monooxygenase SsuD/methylene tetrahydromethanopterin reductase-like flavin-dependent oxidoreductase (luciferase family)
MILIPGLNLRRLLKKDVLMRYFSPTSLVPTPAIKALDIYLKEGIHLPCNDSTTLCAALIGSTKNIGLVLTSSILSEHPFSFARRISTLDHLSKGRIGWNIVTSVTNNAAQNFGLDGIVPHDERYRWAEEYMDVVYKLWEGSWDEGAVIGDKSAGVYARAELVHRIYHEGERYKVAGPHMSVPSPQRVPVLYQAGSSKSGRIFASVTRKEHSCCSLPLKAPGRVLQMRVLQQKRRDVTLMI